MKQISSILLISIIQYCLSIITNKKSVEIDGIINLDNFNCNQTSYSLDFSIPIKIFCEFESYSVGAIVWKNCTFFLTFK